MIRINNTLSFFRKFFSREFSFLQENDAKLEVIQVLYLSFFSLKLYICIIINVFNVTITYNVMYFIMSFTKHYISNLLH